jgi:hypothetical protein
MTPSRLYDRRPACVLVSAPTTTLPVQDEEGCSWFAASFGLPGGIPSRIRIQRPPALEIEAGARGHTGETPMLLWTDCRADLLAEGVGEIDRSPTVNVVRNSPCPSSKGLNYRAKRPALLLCFSDETTSGTLLLTKKIPSKPSFCHPPIFCGFRTPVSFGFCPFRRSRGQRFLKNV